MDFGSNSYKILDFETDLLNYMSFDTQYLSIPE